MSSTNTPVTQADVDEWARDIGAHSDNVSGPVYYNVSKAKWDQVHDMLGRLLAERDDLRDRAEMAEAAQADERSARAMDLARLSKAEAAEAELRKQLHAARDACCLADGSSGLNQPDVDVAAWIAARTSSDAAIVKMLRARAEFGDLPKSGDVQTIARAFPDHVCAVDGCEELAAKRCSKHERILDAVKSGDRGKVREACKGREGDGVLRAFLDEFERECMQTGIDAQNRFASKWERAMAVLARRALGEEGRP